MAASKKGDATAGASRAAVRPAPAGEPAAAVKPAAASIHMIGGAELPVLQGAGVANRRLEAAFDDRASHAALSEPRGRVAYVNPLGVRYVVQAPRTKRRSSANGRQPNARVHFFDGSALDVLQGIGVANKRLHEARASSGLFASLTDAAGEIVFVNQSAVTHVTAF